MPAHQILQDERRAFLTGTHPRLTLERYEPMLKGKSEAVAARVMKI